MQTNRIFTEHETKRKARLFQADNFSKFWLIYEGNADTSEGKPVGRCYIAALNRFTEIKLNTKKIVKLHPFEFYKFKENEIAVSKKYEGEKTFKKI
jgi:hypothetical protein